MDHKYNGHPWCKVKISNIKNGFGLGLKTIGAWGTYVVLTIFASIFSTLMCTMK